MREQGYDLAFALWTGLYASAGTPDAALDKLDGACRRVLRTRPIAEGMARVTHSIRHLKRRDFATFTEVEAEKYRAVIEATGMNQAG